MILFISKIWLINPQMWVTRHTKVNDLFKLYQKIKKIFVII